MKISDIFFEKANEGNGQLLLLGGRPGMGKTTIAIELARGAVLRNMKVGYYSLAMTLEVINKRASRMGYLKDLTAPSFAVNDNPFITVAEIAEECKANHYDLIIIDYFSLLCFGKKTDEERSGIRFAGAEKDKDREIIKKEIDQLRKIATDEACTILVLEQLHRAIDNRYGNYKPTIEDTSLCGLDAEWFDQVFLLYRENYYHEIDGVPYFTVVMKDKEVVFKCKKKYGWKYIFHL